MLMTSFSTYLKCKFTTLVEFTNHLQPNMIIQFLQYKYVFFFFFFFITESLKMYLFIYLLTPVYNLLELINLFITFFIYVFNNII